MKTQHERPKKISKGRYSYHGYTIICVGYHAPDQSIIWEGVNDEGNADYHGYTLKEVINAIDYDNATRKPTQ